MKRVEAIVSSACRSNIVRFDKVYIRRDLGEHVDAARGTPTSALGGDACQSSVGRNHRST